MNSSDIRILDRLYNLRGTDSVILKKIDEMVSKAFQAKDAAENKKNELEVQINELLNEELVLDKQGSVLKDILKNIKSSDFDVVLKKLSLDFNPEEINRKLNDNLPKTLESITRQRKDCEDYLVSVKREMNSSLTEIDELSIRRDEALANQEKLNEYIRLALSGSINITRDSITNLLSKFDFTSEEQRQAAKILMFPEDGLYEYDKMHQGGKELDSFEISVEDVVEEETVEEPTIVDLVSSSEEDIPSFDSVDDVMPVLDEEKEEINFDFNNKFQDEVAEEKEEAKEEIKVVEVKEERKDINDVLSEIGFAATDFSSQDLSTIAKNYDYDLLKKNVAYVSSLGMNKDIFVDNIEFFLDAELEAKIQKLVSIGKEPFDIYLNPNVLIKYNYSELCEAIDILMESGLDPKKVPLMAF